MEKRTHNFLRLRRHESLLLNCGKFRSDCLFLWLLLVAYFYGFVIFQFISNFYTIERDCIKIIISFFFSSWHGSFLLQNSSVPNSLQGAPL